MTSPADYWNQGVQNVPHMTGAASLMDGADIREHAQKLGFSLPFASLLDVGCGTGRVSKFVSGDYFGVDVAKDAVAYCEARGLNACVIEGPEDIPQALTLTFTSAPGQPVVHHGFYEWVACLSVFTHIDRSERQSYLRAFKSRCSNLLVDIIPGDGTGDVALWTAHWEDFQQDIRDAGWSIKAWYDRVGPSGPTHRYSWAVRA